MQSGLLLFSQSVVPGSFDNGEIGEIEIGQIPPIPGMAIRTGCKDISIQGTASLNPSRRSTRFVENVICKPQLLPCGNVSRIERRGPFSRVLLVKFTFDKNRIPSGPFRRFRSRIRKPIRGAAEACSNTKVFEPATIPSTGTVKRTVRNPPPIPP